MTDMVDLNGLDPCVSVTYAARLLKCSRATVDRMAAGKQIVSERIAQRTVIRVDSLPLPAQRRYVKDQTPHARK